MAPALSYVDSHTAPGKGKSYDDFYTTNHFAQYCWLQERRILTSIIQDLFKDRPIHLLDFACGTGRIASALEGMTSSSTGIDVSEPMLEVARSKLRRTLLIKGNILTGDPLPSECYNLITAFRFFVNAEPDLRLAAIERLTALLPPEGYLVFNNHQNRHAPFMLAVRGYQKYFSKSSGLRTMSMGECARLLDRVGLRIVRIYPVGSLHIPKFKLPYWLYRLSDNIVSRSLGLASFAESPVIVAGRATTSRRAP